MAESEQLQLQPAELQKWRFLVASPVLDSRHPRIRSIAWMLWECSGGRPRAFAELAHCVARDCVTYQRDTARVGEEDIAGYTRTPTRNDAVDALQRGADDCDAKARLFVALCLARGLRARMMPMGNRAGMLQHVYAAVEVDGKWLPVETTLRRARIGDEPRSVPFEKGKKEWLR
jgi:transglutaminase-like putative cysteine protease